MQACLTDEFAFVNVHELSNFVYFSCANTMKIAVKTIAKKMGEMLFCKIEKKKTKSLP
jgi:hypothetical protein